MKTYKLSLLPLLLSVTLCAVSAAERGGFRRNAALPADVRKALVEALAGTDGEYAAHAQYSAIIEKFGDVQPYAAIRMAESRHIAALERQLQKYGVKFPANKFEGKTEAPASLTEAAKEAIASEEKNVAMYDQLLEKVEKFPDLTRVFTHLRAASENGHLPAFRTALENGGKVQPGTGGGCGLGCCGACVVGGAGEDDLPLQKRQGGRR